MVSLYQCHHLLSLSLSERKVIKLVYLSVHLGTTAVVPENLVPGVHVLHECILNSLDHPRLVQFEGRRGLLVVSALLRDGLMPLGEPGARRDERPNGALAAAGRGLALGAVQDGDVEAVGSRALESAAPLLRGFGGPARFRLVLRVRRAACVYLRRGGRQGTQDGYQIGVGARDARRRRRAGHLEVEVRPRHLGRAST